MTAIAAFIIVLGIYLVGGATPHALNTLDKIYEPQHGSWAQVREKSPSMKGSSEDFADA